MTETMNELEQPGEEKLELNWKPVDDRDCQQARVGALNFEVLPMKFHLKVWMTWKWHILHRHYVIAEGVAPGETRAKEMASIVGQLYQDELAKEDDDNDS